MFVRFTEMDQWIESREGKERYLKSSSSIHAQELSKEFPLLTNTLLDRIDPALARRNFEKSSAHATVVQDSRETFICSILEPGLSQLNPFHTLTSFL
jgi:hypothetical protein